MFREKITVYLPTKNECAIASDDEQFIRKFEKHNFDTGNAIKALGPDAADLIIVFEQWSFKQKGYRDQLANDEFFKKYAEKIYVVNFDDIVNEGYLPGCYASLKRAYQDSPRFHSCTYPKVYNEQISSVEDITEPTHLFSFMGTSHSHPIRQKIIELFTNNIDARVVDVTKEFHSHTSSDKESYIRNIEQGLFVLCPRGWSPNTYRLYEVMSLGRCPVIISDEWPEITGIEWSECSIRISETEVDRLADILKKYEPIGLKLGAQARKIWSANFSEKAKYQGFLASISKLHLSEAATMSFGDYMRYWNSKEFLANNGWLLRQRIERRLLSIFNIERGN